MQSNEALTRKVLSYDPRGWSTLSGFKLDFGLEVLAWCSMLNPESRNLIEQEVFEQFRGLVKERESRRRKPVEKKPEKEEGIQLLLFDLVSTN